MFVALNFQWIFVQFVRCAVDGIAWICEMNLMNKIIIIRIQHSREQRAANFEIVNRRVAKKIKS